MRPSRLEAGGSWALSFPAADRLKFVTVLRGTCWFLPAEGPSRPLSAGDVILIGKTDYVVASDPAVPAADGLALYDQAGGTRVRLGDGGTEMLGGSVAFATGTSGFLLDMLPSVLALDSRSESAGAVATVLSLLDREVREPRLGAEAVLARLAELLIVEAIRFHASHAGTGETGWLGALADPRIRRALHGFHADIARQWTVASLAGEAGMSRAAFAAAFQRLVGQSPMAYVRAWRLTLARARLVNSAPVAQAAVSVGYMSQSAFGHAYRRAFGTSPGSDKQS